MVKSDSQWHNLPFTGSNVNFIQDIIKKVGLIWLERRKQNENEISCIYAAVKRWFHGASEEIEEEHGRRENETLEKHPCRWTSADFRFILPFPLLPLHICFSSFDGTKTDMEEFRRTKLNDDKPGSNVCHPVLKE